MSAKTKHKICVLGAGSYGTAMAFVSAQQGHDVSLWMRREEVAKKIRETGFHPKRFSVRIFQNFIHICRYVVVALYLPILTH